MHALRVRQDPVPVAVLRLRVQAREGVAARGDVSHRGCDVGGPDAVLLPELEPGRDLDDDVLDCLIPSPAKMAQAR